MNDKENILLKHSKIYTPTKSSLKNVQTMSERKPPLSERKPLGRNDTNFSIHVDNESNTPLNHGKTISKIYGANTKNDLDICKEVLNLKKEIASRENKIHEIEKVKASLEEENSVLKNDIINYSSEKENLKKRLKILEERNSIFKINNEKLEESLNQKMAELELTEKRITDNINRKELLENENENHKSAIQKFEKKTCELERVINTLYTKESILKNKLSKLEKENKTHVIEESTALETKDEISTMLQSVKKEILTAKLKQTENELEIEKLLSDKQILIENEYKLQKELTDLGDRYDYFIENHDQICRFVNECQVLKEDFERMKEEHVAETNFLVRENEHYFKLEKESEEKNQTLASQLEKTHEDMKGLENDFNTLKIENSDLQTKVNENEKQIETLGMDANNLLDLVHENKNTVEKINGIFLVVDEFIVKLGQEDIDEDDTVEYLQRINKIVGTEGYATSDTVIRMLGIADHVVNKVSQFQLQSKSFLKSANSENIAKSNEISKLEEELRNLKETLRIVEQEKTLAEEKAEETEHWKKEVERKENQYQKLEISHNSTKKALDNALKSMDTNQKRHQEKIMEKDGEIVKKNKEIEYLKSTKYEMGISNNNNNNTQAWNIADVTTPARRINVTSQFERTPFRTPLPAEMVKPRINANQKTNKPEKSDE